MKRCLLLLLLAAILPGCDVIAVGAYLANRDDDDSDASGGTIIITAPEEPPAPDPVYRVWIANLPTQADAEAQVDALSAAQGTPDETVWTIIGSSTSVNPQFDPTAPPTSFNTVMVQGSNSVGYALDSVQILDANDVIVAEASEDETYSALVIDPVKAAGSPDGSGATLPPSNDRAFIFHRYAVPIAKIRLRMTGAELSGDLVWSATWPVGTNGGNEIPGGCSIDPLGVLFVSVSDWNSPGSTRDIKLLRFDPEGTLVGETTVESGVTATAGSHAVTALPNGTVTIASTVNNNVMVRRYDNLLQSVEWSTSLDALGQGDALRIQHNGLAVDATGVAIAGAGDDGLLAGGINHRVWKLTPLGTFQWVNNVPGDASAAHWYGVALNNIVVAACGEANSGVLGPVHDSARWINVNGATSWTAQETVTTSAPDRLNAVAIDTFVSPPTIVVAGRFPAAGQGLNAMIMKWPQSGGSTPSQMVIHSGAGNADDEILDIAVDTDGTIYACGYESPGNGEGQNFWVRRYGAAGNVIWTRTHHAGADERAVSLALFNDRVYVVGQEIAQGGNTRVIVRTYAK